MLVAAVPEKEHQVTGVSEREKRYSAYEQDLLPRVK